MQNPRHLLKSPSICGMTMRQKWIEFAMQSIQGIHNLWVYHHDSQWVEPILINLQPHSEGDRIIQNLIFPISVPIQNNWKGNRRYILLPLWFICTHYQPSSTLRCHWLNQNAGLRTNSKSCSHQNRRAFHEPIALVSWQRMFILLRYAQITSSRCHW